MSAPKYVWKLGDLYLVGILVKDKEVAEDLGDFIRTLSEVAEAYDKREH